MQRLPCPFLSANFRINEPQRFTRTVYSSMPLPGGLPFLGIHTAFFLHPDSALRASTVASPSPMAIAPATMMVSIPEESTSA